MSSKAAILELVTKNVSANHKDDDKIVAAMPEELKGRLFEAVKDLEGAQHELQDDTPFAFASVVARNMKGGEPLRTGADLVSDLTADVSQAKTYGEAREVATNVQRRFLNTGVYNNVAVHHETSPSGKGLDLVVELDEGSSLMVEQGVSRTSSGAIGTSTAVALRNVLGWGEKWSANIGATAGQGALSAEPGASFMQRTQHLQQAMAPMVRLGFSKPTFFGLPAPFSVSVNSETQHNESTLGFSKKLSEVEMSVSDPTNSHSLSYSYGIRDILPLPHPTSHFLTASAPHVVASSTTSTKSALRYSCAINRLKTHPKSGIAVPASGVRFNSDIEVAGPGGEAHFVKGEASVSAACSLWRYQPDTGYQRPLPKHDFIEREATLASGGAAAEILRMQEEEENAADGNLKSHPGTKVFCPTMMFGLKKKPSNANHHSQAGNNSTAASASGAAFSSFLPSGQSQSKQHKAKPYTFGQRMAGWMSPGFTFLFDASFGALKSFGPDAGGAGNKAVPGIAADPSPSPSTTAAAAAAAGTAASAAAAVASTSASLPRLADRFFLTSLRMRGFQSVGPTAARVAPHGSPFGDSVGGDAYALLTARLLMPPPLPSVRLANAGVRTQLWASAGKVGSLDSLVAGGHKALTLTNPSKMARRLLAGSHSWSASAGVGMSVAIPGQSFSIELNVPLWHAAQQGDTAAPKGTLSIFWAS